MTATLRVDRMRRRLTPDALDPDRRRRIVVRLTDDEAVGLGLNLHGIRDLSTEGLRYLAGVGIVRKVRYDEARQCWLLLVTHRSFDEVPEFGIPPEHTTRDAILLLRDRLARS